MIFLLTNHNPQTNTRNISGTCIVRKKSQSGMSKSKPQGMMINEIVGFLANSHVLIFAGIDHKTTNIPEISQVFIILSEFHRKIH